MFLIIVLYVLPLELGNMQGVIWINSEVFVFVVDVMLFDVLFFFEVLLLLQALSLLLSLDEFLLVFLRLNSVPRFRVHRNAVRPFLWNDF